MWPIRRTALLLATAVGVPDAFAGDDPAPNPEVAWPAPKAGVTAVWRASLTIPVPVAPSALALTVEFAAEALPTETNGTRDLRLTCGRARGTESGVSQGTVDWIPPAFAVPGRAHVVRPGAPDTEADSLLEFAFLAAPPATSVRVGSSWQTGAPDDVRWVHVVEAIDATSVRIRSEAPRPSWAPPPPKPWTARMERRLSREDGLLLDGSFSLSRAAGTTESGRFERIPPVEPPWAALAVERALAILAGGESGTQAAAAAAIGRLWPYGARAAPMLAAAIAGHETELRSIAAFALDDLSRRAVAFVVETVKNLPDPDPTGYRHAVEALGALGGAVTLSDLASYVVRDPVGGTLAAGLFATDPTREVPGGPWAPYVLFLDRATARFAAGMDLADVRAFEAASAAVALLALRALPVSAAPDPPPEIAHLLTSADPIARWTGERLADLFAGGRRERPSAPIASAPTSGEVAAWKAALSGSDASARRMAALRLAASGQETTESAPILVEWLRDLPADEAVAGDVIATIGRLGECAESALPLLDAIRVRRDEPQPRHSFLLATLAAEAASRIDAPNAERVAVLLQTFRPLVEPRREGAVPYEARRAAYEALLDLFDGMETALEDAVIDALLDEVPMGTGPARDERTIAFVAEHASRSDAAAAALVRAYERSRDRLGVLVATGVVVPVQDGAQRVRALGSEYVRPWAARYAILQALRQLGPAAGVVRDLAASLRSSDDPLVRYLATRFGGLSIPR